MSCSFDTDRKRKSCIEEITTSKVEGDGGFHLLFMAYCGELEGFVAAEAPSPVTPIRYTRLPGGQQAAPIELAAGE